MSELNKDFYSKLPGMVCVQLDDYIIKQFSDREWFSKFWEEYRQHVHNSNMDDMKMPGAYLKKYINLDTKEDLEESESI